MTQAVLAQPAAEARNPIAPVCSLLRLAVGHEVLAVTIDTVREILEVGRLTALPRTPDFVRGVMNLRGAVVPVVDLLARFGSVAAVPGKRACIVIIEVAQEGARQDVGILVDSVSEVLDIDAANIEPPPAFGAGLRADFIRCMARMGSEFVIVLDVDRIFSLDELAQVGETRLAA